MPSTRSNLPSHFVINFFIKKYSIFYDLVFSRKRHIASEREKAEMPNFGPTIIPEPDTSTPSTPVGKKPMLLRNMPIYLFLPISRLKY